MQIGEHTAASGFDVQQFDVAAERLYLPREVAGEGEGDSRILAQRPEQRPLGVGSHYRADVRNGIAVIGPREQRGLGERLARPCNMQG
jgi:hypothetical protein